MKTSSNVKTGKETKEKAKKLAAKLGLSLDAVMEALLKQFVRTQELHLSLTPRMTPELEALIGRAERDWKAGKNISPAFSSGREMDRWLNS